MSQADSFMTGGTGMNYLPDYFPMIFAPHFSVSEEDTCVYFYKFADFDKKMRELGEESLPGDPDRWYKMTFDGEYVPITVPDVDAADNVHDYLYLDTLFDCSELVAAAQKVLVKRARKNHIIPMCWYGANVPGSEELQGILTEGDLDYIYSNYYNNILGLAPTSYGLDSAISANSGWQNAIEFGC